MEPSQDLRASISEGVSEGDVLAGKFRIDRVLGVGGMGVVAEARHLQLDERVAIKFLLPQALQNAEAVSRFAREARAAVKIKSEHVARVTDVGTLDTGAPYMVMEFLEGTDLSERLKNQGPLPIADAVEFTLQACEAIAEAHGLKIVHRDIKPSNLFVIRRPDGSPSVKVLDFGISKVTGMTGSGADLGMTKTQAMMGSPLYMSPEQMASSRDVDGRTDIWALGVTLFELLTGHPPFDAESIPQLCTMILQQRPPALRNHRPDAPPGLENIIFRCLEKDRNLRYANVAELANALALFAPDRARHSAERVSRLIEAAGLTAGAVTSPVGTQPVQATSSIAGATNAAWGRTDDGAGSRTALWVVAAAAVLLVGGGVAYAVLRTPKTIAELPSKETPSAVPSAFAARPEAIASGVAVEPATATPPATSASASALAAVGASSSAPVAAAPPLVSRTSSKTGKTTATTAKSAKPAQTATPTTSGGKAPKRLEDLYGDRK